MKPAPYINENWVAQGFTLMELVVVLVLVSLTVTFAIPKIRSTLYTDELKAAARRLIGLVAEVGQEARLKNVPFEL
ncbi:MAG: prepilin-type N-terminal cleavage/methylation domain-containing protein, partial [Candidatus Electrothrix sp. AR4]|nr:prepilin-type N-terminal cleavage/methylation domain-containing protein [Candidatus Electrothrix sp. AR4]